MSAVEKLAREILETRRLALGHATAPQLGFGSLDGGRISFRGPNGEVVGDLGIAVDGGISIEHYEGPKPPTPTTPTVKADAGILSIGWDGGFESDTGDDPASLPTSDVDRVEVHASQDENFVPDRVLSFGGAYASLDGGLFALGPLPEAGTWYVRLVARSKAGKYSAPSARVEQEVAIASMDLAVTDAWLTGEAAQTTADGKNSIFRGPDEPDPAVDGPFKDGDIWFQMTEDGKSIPNTWDETAGAWVANDDYRQSEIERVQQELRDDLDAIVVDGSGTTNYYQGTPPDESSSPPPKEGDLWFDDSDNNRPYIYQDDGWVTVRDSFAQPGAAAEIAGPSSVNAAERQWSNVAGFEMISTLFSATVPSGAPAGTAKLVLPFQGRVDSSGTPVFDATGVPTQGLPVGASGEILLRSSGAAPTVKLVAYLEGGALQNPVTLEMPFIVEPTTVGQSTHRAVWDPAQDKQLTTYTPLVNSVAFALEVTVDSVSGNFVDFNTSARFTARLLVSGPGIQDKAITTSKIAAGAITAESGIIGSINAGTITVGEMEGARIKAGTVGTDKLLVGSGGNVIPTNPDPSIIDFPDLTYDSTEKAIAAARGTYYSATEFTLPAGKYRMTVDLKSTVEGERVYIGIYHPTPRWNYGINNQAVTTEWQTYTGVITVPEGEQGYPYVLRYLPNYQGSYEATTWFRNLRLQPVAGATLIEGGAITTEHIRTGTITAESGIIGSIDANVITVGKIMGNQLDADAINGKTITGATIRTASSGSRVELTQNGLKQYNALGQVVTDMSLGRLSLIGDIATGFDGERRVEIKQNLWTDGAGIVFAPEGGSINDLSKQARVGSPSPGGIVLASESLPGSMKQSLEASPDDGMQLKTVETDSSGLEAGRLGLLKFDQADSDPAMRGTYWGVGTRSGSTNSMKSFVAIASDDAVNHWAGIEPNEMRINANAVVISKLKSPQASASLTAEANSFSVMPHNASATTGRLSISGADGDDEGSITVTGGASPSLRISASGGIYPSAYQGSGSSLVIASDGRLARQISSRRYKDNIESAFVDDTILSLQPVTFQYKQQIEEYDRRLAAGEPVEGTDLWNGPPTVFGLIAEDAADAGVDYLVLPDLEGNPESISYERIGVALIPIVRDLRDRIIELEAQLAS